MRLSDFIRQNRAAISSEWQAFAGSLKPAASMTDLQLADHIDEMLTFIADDMETVQTAGEQAEKSKGKAVNGHRAETAAQTHATLRHTDGFDVVEMVSEYRALRATVTKLWAPDDKLYTKQDVDDLGRFNEAIDQTLAESVLQFTEDVDKAKGLLLSVLGHDIKSPVGAILMAVDLVPQFGEVNPKQLHALKQIKASADRVQHIVGDLVDLAKTNTGQGLPLKKSQSSLTTICEQIVDETRVRHADRQISLDIAERVDGEWDGVRMGQLLGNLLANAVQYGDPTKPIEVKLRDQGDIVLAVTNQGEPIPSTHLESIFKSFSRVNRSETGAAIPTSNLGLGLFISKEIAMAHGGTISVVSSRAEGTTFTVRLPKTAPDRTIN